MIHYKWIKGLDAEGQGWCFIKFEDYEQPHFYVGDHNTDDESELESYGGFILSDYDAMQYITNGLSIGRMDSMSDYSHSFVKFDTGSNSFYINYPDILKAYTDSNSYIQVEPKIGITYNTAKYTYSGANFVFKDSNSDAAKFQFQNSSGTLLGCFSPNGGQSISTSGSAYYYGDLTFKTGDLFLSNGYVEAQYFNATSDIRAKKDVNELDFNALDMVKSTPVYTYTYKDNNSHSMGIMAQDLLNYSFNGFDLVDNKEASGENNDYMSVKESKLVFVLWKAVQELTKEVEDLKAQLNK